MFSWYYLYLILIFLFFVLCPGVLRIVKGDDSVTVINYIHLCNKGKKNTECSLLAHLSPLTCTSSWLEFSTYNYVINFVKFNGNQMSIKVVTCKYLNLSNTTANALQLFVFFHIIYFTPIMNRVWCKVLGFIMFVFVNIVEIGVFYICVFPTTSFPIKWY